MNILGILYVGGLLIGAGVGAALLLVTLVLLTLRRTRVVGAITLAGALGGAAIVIAGFVILALLLSGTLRYIGSEMWPIWALIGAAAGGIPTFVVSGAAQLVVAWVRSRKAQRVSTHVSSTLLEKFEKP